MSTALIIPAAGAGTRLGAGRPKAFVMLAGRTLLAHAVEGAVRSGVVDVIVIAAPAALVDEARRIAAAATEAAAEAVFGSSAADPTDAAPPAADRADRVPRAVGQSEDGPSSAQGGPLPRVSARPVPILVVAGGEDRVVSVAAALAVVPSAARVLVHDAARCLTPAGVFHRIVEALDDGAAAVVPVLPVTDTVKTATDHGTVVGDLERSTLRRVQTPQGFTRDVLVAAHDLQCRSPDPAATDDAGLVERLDVAVVGVTGDEAALKITHAIDLRIAELYLDRPSTNDGGSTQVATRPHDPPHDTAPVHDSPSRRIPE